jgi:hypothetical protein
VDRIRRFEGPVLAEREFRAKEAQRATVRGRGEAGPGPRLGEIVTQRLADAGASADEVDWDSRKRQDGNWQVQLAYTVAGRMRLAEWVYDSRSKHVTPDDDEAMRLCLSESEWPEPRPAGRAPATATVTPIGSRAAAASAHPSAADQRGQLDRSAGRGALHPSRQPPGTAVGSAAASRESGREPAASGLAEIAAAVGELEDASQAPAQPAAADTDAAPSARPARRASGARSRRSSVPSWDEIMFGNSRQPD